MSNNAFRPIGTGLTSATSTTAVRLKIPQLEVQDSGGNMTTGGNANKYARAIQVGGLTVAHYVKVGNASVVAVAGDVMIPAGDARLIEINPSVDTHVSILASSATGTANVVSGRIV